jgi:chromate transporter
MVALAAAAFLAIFLLHLPFPVIILAAGLTGYIGGRIWPQGFVLAERHDEGPEAAIRDEGPSPRTPCRPLAGRCGSSWLDLRSG